MMPRSLVGRVALGFITVYAGTLAVIVVALEVASAYGLDRYRGADTVVGRLGVGVLSSANGEIRFAADPVLSRLSEQNPGMWYVARSELQTRTMGPAPQTVLQQIQGIPIGTWDAVLFNMPVSHPDGEIDYAVIRSFDTPAGPLLIAVGGVDPTSPAPWVAMQRWHVAGAWLAVIVLALIGLVVVCVITSIAIRTVRPLTRAVQTLNPDDPNARIPLDRIVREMEPIVAAFNAALARVEATAERRRRFMADVAHEFRTPLAVLSMHADALPSCHAKGEMQRGVFRLSQMIGQMLDSERLSFFRIEREQVDLVQLSKSALADIAPLAVDAGYDLAFTCDTETVKVTGDERAIRRAVTNLLGNAVAHAGGSGTISIKVSESGWLQVTDEGPGLSAEAADRVFEPFHRERWDLDGCGLGLHLVREIMKTHGGQAAYISGQAGATFRLTFPEVSHDRTAS